VTWWAIVGLVVTKKRPCTVCRCWFVPNARVGDRQRTCGSSACQEARRERTHRAWREENRDYDRDRRWRLAIGAAKADPTCGPPGPHAPAPMSGVPWEVVQTEMEVEGRVILAGVVRVMGSFVQTEIRRQAMETTPGVVRHGQVAAQTEMAGLP
jgi:hypothetical protein